MPRLRGGPPDPDSPEGGGIRSGTELRRMREAANAGRKRAVILLSGGLDSTLAAKMMLDQGIELHAIHFTSPFCT
ncbi:MAG TPA: hypothetical protein DD658_06550, partial [Deltaproteobacteria bacterium]|nr:hypothetical protein [Deltaproteobacteria bacterium]